MHNKFTNFYTQLLKEFSFDTDSTQDDFDHFEFRRHNPLMFDRQNSPEQVQAKSQTSEDRISTFTHQIFNSAKECECDAFVHRFYEEIGQLAAYYSDTTEFTEVVSVKKQDPHKAYYNSESDQDGDIECVEIYLNVTRDNQDIQQKILLILNSLTDEKEIDIETV